MAAPGPRLRPDCLRLLPSTPTPLWKKWLKRAAAAAALGAVVAVLGLWLAVRHFEAGLPGVTDLRAYHAPQITRVLARDGTLLSEIFTQRRTVIPIATLPAHVKLAVLAAEDAGFYEHQGLNYWGIARAMLVNLRSRGARQGGSTITQQVVKNLLLTNERTLSRKIREALLSRKLEQDLSKDEILELYVNNIYFGRGRYGIEEAARDDFGKSARDLTIAQAALIAGRIANPRDYGPRASMQLSLARRAYVLGQMHEKGFLSDAQWLAASQEPVTLAPAETSSELAPEAVELAKNMLDRIEPDIGRSGGFTITTSIDATLQAAARKAVRETVGAYDKRHGAQDALKAPATADRKGRSPPPRDALTPFEGTPNFELHRVLVGTVAGTDDAADTLDVRVGTALGVVRLGDYERYNPGGLVPSAFAPIGARVRVSLLGPVPAEEGEGAPRVPLRMESGPEAAFVAIDVRTREILALVGSYEGQAGALDRATQSRRQPGSTFKPIVYSYAIHSRRVTAATLVDPNADVFEGGYHPSNFEGYKGHDPLRLREALANSVNVAAVRVIADVGPANVVSWAQALGIESPMKPDLSLALGSYEVRPLELAGAYATFAAGGVYEEPHLVLRVVGPDGKDVALPQRPPARRVLDDAEAYVVTNMLTSVIDHGTGARAKALGRPLAGKTGTSNGPKDTWFAGYSADVAAVVWVGFDDGRLLGSAEQGAVTALPAWMSFMKVAHEGRPRVDFPRPPGVSTVTIDQRTGALPYPDDPDVLDEVFLAGTEPSATAAPPPPDDAGAPDAASAAAAAP
jgi:penicillin-binding protein 1A